MKGFDLKMNRDINKSFVSFKTTFGVCLALTVVSTLLRLYHLFTSVEFETGLYKYSSNAHTVFSGVAVVCLIAIIVLNFLSVNKPFLNQCTKKSTAEVIVSGLIGMLLFFLFIFKVFLVANNNGSFSLLLISELAFCILSSIYFFARCCNTGFQNTNGTAILSVFPCLFIALRVISYFLDTTVVVTSSVRHLSLLYMCASMLFLLYDAKLLVRPANSKKEFLIYTICTFLCIYFAFTSPFAHLVASFAGKVKSDSSVIQSLGDCLVGVYAISRIGCYLSVKNETK